MPSFVFIGPGKVGSSWFLEILREHPGVFMPANKGTVYFTRFHYKGVAWFEQFFRKATAGQVTGEICEEYLSSPEAIRRIRDYRPDMRLICCLRNPYERAISSWRFYGRNGCQEPTLVAQAARNPQVFLYGQYATQLQVVQALFPPDQLLIFLFEELAADPRGVARRLYEFIGVDPDFSARSLNERVNVNGRPRWRLLAKVVHKIHERSWGPSRLISNLVGRLKRVRVVRQTVRAILYDESERSGDWRGQFSEFPDHIVTRYEQEITALERMLGRDLSAWRAPAAPIRRGSAPAAKPAIGRHSQVAADLTGSSMANRSSK
ncbi:MAG: sulfotransferase domain-containing protein [Steroidobacteraceae bacterium]